MLPHAQLTQASYRARAARRWLQHVRAVLSMPSRNSPRPEWQAHKIEGHYDIRRGAAGYAPIVGAFGALAVPAIIVLFGAAHAGSPAYIAMAAGLLIVAMVGSLIASIALSAVGAERDETANLYATTMFEAVAVVISLAAVLGAFEVLAALYLPGVKILFLLIVGVAGVIGIFFTALAIADSWQAGPSDPRDRAAWLPRQWLQNQRQAEEATWLLVAIGCVPAGAGIVLRLLGVMIPPTTVSATIIVGMGFLLTMASIVLGAARSRHAIDGFQKAVQPREALGTTLTASGFIMALMIFLP